MVLFINIIHENNIENMQYSLIGKLRFIFDNYEIILKGWMSLLIRLIWRIFSIRILLIVGKYISVNGNLLEIKNFVSCINGGFFEIRIDESK